MQLMRYRLAVLGTVLMAATALQAQPGVAPSAATPAVSPEAAKPEASAHANAALPPTTDASGAKVYSYGIVNYSVFFTPKQIDHMKSAIRSYEDTPHETAATTFVAPVEVEKPAEVKIDEPQNYPVFYLASIAYDTPSDWSLWISGHKITSHRNDTDVKVIAVSRDSATFQWKPAYANAITQRRNGHSFADSEPVKNKLADAQNISFDDATGTTTFTLRQNQSFVVGYFKLFEGYIPTPKMEALNIVANGSSALTDEQQKDNRIRDSRPRHLGSELMRRMQERRN